MGWTAIAVYSDADRGARHVRCADEAYRLGASPAAQSYLDQRRLIELARRVGADAVHPGLWISVGERRVRAGLHAMRA